MRNIRILLWAGICLAGLYLAGCRSGGEGDVLSGDWAKIEAAARGSRVHWAMDGADARANAWIDGYVAREVRQRYGITLVRVPLGGDAVVGRLVQGRDGGGAPDVDLFGLMGNAFARAREAGVLYGPIAGKLPNYTRYANKSLAAYDFGTLVEGYEVPLGWMQFSFRYALDRVGNPPRTLMELLDWIKVHPGRFAYPAPPDFTGSAFLRQILCTLAGGPKARLTQWDKSLFARLEPKVWATLRQMAPGLWQGGRRYPADAAEVKALFDKGEIDVAAYYGSPYVERGRETRVGTFILSGGTPGNMHFLAVPKDAANKAGALVVADFLLSPEAQYDKYLPTNWGDCPCIAPDALQKEEWDRFAAVDRGPGAVPLDRLRREVVPEAAPEYGSLLDADWAANKGN